jgi:hypothetical protein
LTIVALRALTNSWFCWPKHARDEKQIDSLKRRFREDYLPTSGLPDTVTTFCTFEVGERVLTPWQCEKLRNGQRKGFFLDNYALLDAIGHDDRNNYYLGRDTQSGQFVRIIVTQPRHAKSAQIEYRVDDQIT